MQREMAEALEREREAVEAVSRERAALKACRYNGNANGNASASGLE
jgi:hypothetical protein